MKNKHKYNVSDKMSALICDNYSLLSVMSRFGLRLGFGDASVGEVCAAQNVDCATFLSVINFIAEERDSIELTEDFSVESLMKYLGNAHTYFLDFKLPAIRKKLVEAIGDTAEDKLAMLVIKFFDEYVMEIGDHMDYEDRNVFKYTQSLLEGNVLDTGFNIYDFARNHERAESKLTELKNIIIKYYPQVGCSNLMNDVLYDIYNCEADLALHSKIENFMFVPSVIALERRLKNK